MMEIVVISISIVTAIIVTGQVLVYARRHLLDRVTERSSHHVPTPRGGGMGLVAAVVAAWMVGVLLGGHWTWTAGVVLASLLVLAMLGWWDDHVGLRARSRLPVQLAVAGAVVWALGLPGTGTIGPWIVSSPVWLSALVAVLGVVWTVNLTNFMDGIDGLAGSQGMVAGLAAAALLGMETLWGSLGLATAGACLGFLWWNRPPARIFMGDVGSTALGLIFAVLILAQVGQGMAIEVALLPLAPFVLDATCTLIRRAWRREALAQAHRSHLYQRLARIWGGHLPVTVVYTVLASIATVGAWLAHHAWISSSIVIAVVVGIFIGLSWCARRVVPA